MGRPAVKKIRKSKANFLASNPEPAMPPGAMRPTTSSLST